MIYTSESIQKAINSLSSLPTIGKKTAQRLVFFLLKQDNDYIINLTDSLKELKDKVKFCSSCFNFSDYDPCPICSSPKRDNHIICVVEEPNDVFAIEKTGDYSGLYHVLHGTINPLEGISVNDIKIKELIARLTDINEVILALNPSVEGEVTTQYLAKIIKPLSIKVTRIARGLPIGSNLEYVDEATISKAIDGRIEI